jgi:hypothetical protein
MIGEHQFEHGFAGLAHLIIGGGDVHALGDHRRASGLQLGHLFDLDHAHAACALEREAGVIAKRGHFDARGFAGLDQQSSRGSGQFLSIDNQVNVWHESL